MSPGVDEGGADPPRPTALDSPSSQTVFEIVRETEAAAYLRSALGPERYLTPDTSFAASWHTCAQLVDEVLSRPAGLTVVEMGSGVSTIWLALAVQQVGGGAVISFEHDPEYLTRTQELIDRHGVGDVVRLVLAPLTETIVDGESVTWYDEQTVRDAVTSRIDILFVDGPPGSSGALTRLPAVPVLAERLADLAVVVLDDASRADEARVHELWLQRPEYGPRVQASHRSGRSLLDRLGPRAQ